MKGKLRWTDKQKEVAQLITEGKEFNDIVASGYSLHMVSKVKAALAKGQSPGQNGEGEAEIKSESGGGNGKQNLVSVKAPKSSPIVFTINKKEIALDPLELNTQYRYYQDLTKRDGMSYSFSEIQTIGIQLVWILTQDIPLTENMISGIIYG